MKFKGIAGIVYALAVIAFAAFGVTPDESVAAAAAPLLPVVIRMIASRRTAVDAPREDA